MVYPAEKVLNEFEKVLDGYTGLLTCRLLNLCVKAHPIALIPVRVELWGEEKDFEEVADCAIPDDDHIEAYPKSEEFLFAIGKGVLEVHPEFIMKEKTVKMGGQDMRILSFKMPPVDKDRRDLLNNAVDAFYQETKAQHDETKAKYSVKIADRLSDASKEDADNYKKRFDDAYQNNCDIAKQTVDDKKKEIEEAYQRYLQNKATAEKAEQEQQAAEGEDVKSKLTFPS